MSFHVPNQFRIRTGPVASDDSYGNNGCFSIPSTIIVTVPRLNVIASDGMGWEHVSVSTPLRCPVWEEMCFIKNLFWDDTDWVIQFHPPKSEYVNNHPFVLHLWRQIRGVLSVPPSLMVGFKELNL